MTNVGKLLVLFNLALSIIFLGFAIMVRISRLDLSAKLNEAKGEVRVLTDKKKELSDKTGQLQEEIDKQKKRAADVTADNESQATTLKNAIETVARGIQLNNENIAKANQQFTEESQRQQQMRMQNHEMARQLNELQQENETVLATRADLRNRLAQTENNLANLKAREQGLQQRVAALESELGQ